MTMRERLQQEFKDRETRHAYVDSLIDSTIASQLKFLREQRDWTQNEVATLAGMKQSRISAMEDANYSSWNITTLKRLAVAFDCGLEVRFVPFTRVLDWATHLSPEDLRVNSYEADTAPPEKPGDTWVGSMSGVVQTRPKPLKVEWSPTPASLAVSSTTTRNGTYGKASETNGAEYHEANRTISRG